MAAKRVTKRNLKEIIRLGIGVNLSLRQIHVSTKTSIGTVQRTLARARELKLNWPLADELDETKLEALLFPKTNAASLDKLAVLNWAEIRIEFKKKGITKQLLWEEYKEQHSNNGYSYSQ